jgi:ergothioneine biosynthesis protein EgtB
VSFEAASVSPLERLRAAWRRSDALFETIGEEAWTAQPIPLRQPFVFYLGHLPAFAWNHLGRGVLGRAPLVAEFDALFERGIDPVGVDAYTARAQWPSRDAILAYRDRVRALVRDALSDPAFLDAGAEVAWMVVEHELMHHETLLYMLQELDHGSKRRPAGWPALPGSGDASGSREIPSPRTVHVPAGTVRLGAGRGTLPFAWDNEMPEQRVRVEGFSIDALPVTNAELLEFVRDGGYDDGRLWRASDWAWRERHRLSRPHSWRGEGEALAVRSLFEDVPFERAALWPASVSWAEASAFARWRGARLPTEAEWRHAACGFDAGARANVDFRHGSPLPVASGADASAWGVRELVGDGWEWTASPFAPFPGFSPMPRYPGYSADFFDGEHFVLLGGSWATDSALLRPSFRNWFQPRYPYVFSKFRCVHPRG